jgi:hypothetical protein
MSLRIFRGAIAEAMRRQKLEVGRGRRGCAKEKGKSKKVRIERV